jgi:hypothetical protein
MRFPLFQREASMIERLTSPASLALGAGVVAAAGGVLWRTLHGGSDSAPDQIAALTAQAVADAAREAVLESVEESAGAPAAALTAAAAEAVREAALAGADITAAALGAIEGASIAARIIPLSREDAVEAARLGVLSAARTVGPPALSRVERVLELRGS